MIFTMLSTSQITPTSLCVCVTRICLQNIHKLHNINDSDSKIWHLEDDKLAALNKHTCLWSMSLDPNTHCFYNECIL